jgi:tetratricopeptide (TPR) repeat protein
MLLPEPFFLPVHAVRLGLSLVIPLFTMIRWFRQYPARCWIATSILIVGLTLAIWLLSGQFSSWQQRRLLTSAQTFLQRGDLRSAMVSCQQLIQLNPNYIDAYPVLISIDEQVNSPRAITWASKIVELSQNDPKALIQVAGVALKFGETEVAQEALERLPSVAKDTAIALSLQGTIDVLGGRLSKAENLFERAAELEASNLSHRLNLLKIRLQFRDSAKADPAREELERLARDSSTKADALRALLEDARTHGQSERALCIARQLASAPDAPFSDQLVLLQELSVSAKSEFSAAFVDLRQKIQSSDNSGLIFQLMSWQNAHGLYQATLDWKSELPANLADSFPIQLAEVEALMGLKNWIQLHGKIVTEDWGWMNYLRLAIYARVERELGSSDFRERWESALVATAGEWNAILQLANIAEQWGWKEQAVQAFWIIARQSQGQRIALKRLYQIYAGERNTPELYKVAKRILEVDPRDLVAVNNVASLGLLLDQDRDQAAKLAEDVYHKDPSIPAFSATYAFALVRNRQPEKALQILKGLSVQAAGDPAIGLYYGLALAANGQVDVAKPYLQTALRSNHLFPEEETLARQALVP